MHFSILSKFNLLFFSILFDTPPKIEAQLEKLKQLKAQKQAIEAREKTKQKEQERKDDTRRKILLGSYLIKKMNDNEANKEKILAELSEYLVEDRDRKLFSLPSSSN